MIEYEVRIRATADCTTYIYAESEDEALEKAQEKGFEHGDYFELSDFNAYYAKTV